MAPCLSLLVLLVHPLWFTSLNQSQGERDDGSLFGQSVARVGDVDADGVPDFVVGSPKINSDPDAIGAAWLVSTRTGKALFEVTDGQPLGAFGEVVAGPGDLDGDGTPDFLVAAPWKVLVAAYSGRTGSLLHTVRGVRSEHHSSSLYLSWMHSGLSACGVGDVNDDGCDDYAVGCMHSTRSRRAPGSIWIISGRDGSRLRSMDGKVPDGHYGVSLSTVGDLDGDGGAELALWAPMADAPIQIVSIRSGAVLRALRPNGADEAREIQLTGAGDLDGDAVPDLLASMILLTQESPSSVQAFSGRDGSLLRTWRQRGEWWFGRAIDSFGDLDLDGTPDLLVTSPASGSYSSWAYVLSGREDRVIRENMIGPLSTGYFGISACVLGDVDGDGVKDYLVGEASWRCGAQLPGIVGLFSGKTGLELAEWVQEDIQPCSR